jgi:hypothetical protein
MASTSDYARLINAAANNNGFDPRILTSVINAESGGDPSAVSPTSVRGLAQITGDTWKQYFPGVPYSTDPADQVNAAATILSKYSSDYGGNVALMAAAYNGGPAVANRAQTYITRGMSPYDAIHKAAGEVYGSGSAKQAEVDGYAQKVTNGYVYGTGDSSVGSATPIADKNLTVDDSDVPEAVSVAGAEISADQVAGVEAAIDPPLVIAAGLDETAWFDQPNIVQVDGATKGISSPVTFAVYFDRDGAPMPLVIRLNASVNKFSKRMSHIVAPKRTHTGWRVPVWGLQPDTISGSASTGMFMNQFGLSSFLSVSEIDESVKDALQRGWSHGENVFNQNVTGAVSTTLRNQHIPEIKHGGLRQAAKDAFVEFLMLFKQNGVVYYRNPDYTGYTSSQTQLGPNAWSPKTGSSIQQNAARRNDVMTRGWVVMYFRNTSYAGYFKSLTWSEDANSPFHWNFNFVFQVERTISVVGVPLNG